MNIITIDITTTKSCNFNCSYCFESGMHESKHMSKESFDKIIDFMKTHKNFYNIMIMGGEPSIAPNLSYFLKKLKMEIENKTIKLLSLEEDGNSVYITNGYKNILHQLTPDEDFWKKYLQIQISYDGKIIQDKYRKTIDGKPTSEIVLNTFKNLYDQGFYTTMKSTIDIQDFKHLKEIILEFKELKDKYNIQYNVTENKDSFKYISEEEILNQIEYFKEILKIEKEYYLKNKSFITRWLQESKIGKPVYCSAGVQMFHVNTDETVQPCHLSLYNKNQINYGTIDNFLTNFNKNKKYFYGVNENKCENCSAVYCIRCPMDKYNQNPDLNELYNGMSNDKICFYYQEISKYIFYLKRKLNIW